MNTIQEQWLSFEKMVIPKNAPLIQHKEMRIAFYAGAQAMINALVVIGDDKVSEDAGVAMLDGYMTEMEMFCNQLEIK